ncbi:unnamed protein product [Sphagnum balticum]
MTGFVKNLGSKLELVSKAAPASSPGMSSSSSSSSLVVLHFWASWCEPCKAMDVVFAQLAADTPHAQFFRVEAEEQLEISEEYEVTAVPFFVFLKDGVVVDKLQGANAPELANKVSKWSTINAVTVPMAAAAAAVAGPPTIQEDITKQSVVPAAPPTQSCSIQQIEKQQSETDHNKELAQLINQSPIMLFIKGNPKDPCCGFSRKVVDVLNAEGVKFGSFDVLSDDAVRQGLKEFSNWPTFPQLYVQGELLGGCDIVSEMHQSGELKEILLEKGLLQLPTKEEEIDRRLKKLIHSSQTMLFMKGTPNEPRCGFSNKVVSALREEGVEFSSFDILTDEEVRQGLKIYSNWPTYPQLYHKGELLGGCDIVLEMKESGELRSTLEG